MPHTSSDEQSIPRHGRYSVIFTISTVVTIAAWVMLARSYALPDHYQKPGFSFDKISGNHLWSTLRTTALLFLLLIMAYGASAWSIVRTPRVTRGRQVAIIAGATGAAFASIVMYPVAAIDIFYYLAELKLTYEFHLNPYETTFLPRFEADPLARYGWPLHVPLAYGPAWLWTSWVPVLLGGFDSLLTTLLAYKTWSALAVAVCGVLIAVYHTDPHRRWLALHLFLGNPFLWFEAVANGHNDIIMACFIVAGVLALRRRSLLAGPLIVLALLVKLVAVVLVPAMAVLAVTRLGWSRSRLALSTLLGAIVAIAIALPFWSDGAIITGMGRGMAFASNLKTPSLLSLTQTILHDRQLAHWFGSARILFAGAFLGLAAFAVWKLTQWERALAWILLLLFTLAGSLQPWYWIAVIALFVLRPNAPTAAYLVLASALNLLIHLVDVWARLESGLSFTERHLLGTVVLNVPLVGFLAWDALVWPQKWARERKLVQPGSHAEGGA